MKQINLIPVKRQSIEHGGSVSVGKRKSQRPLSLKRPLHLVLRSNLAYGSRSLMRHRPLIERIINKSKKRFAIRVYEFAIVSNHIHLLVKGYSRRDLQNFFRVVAGHIAQEILRICPLTDVEKVETGGAPKNKESKFWLSRVYTRIVSWGREYIGVRAYVIQNSKEALKIIPYRPRKVRRKVNRFTG